MARRGWCGIGIGLAGLLGCGGGTAVEPAPAAGGAPQVAETAPSEPAPAADPAPAPAPAETAVSGDPASAASSEPASAASSEPASAVSGDPGPRVASDCPADDGTEAGCLARQGCLQEVAEAAYVAQCGREGTEGDPDECDFMYGELGEEFFQGQCYEDEE